MNAALRRNYLQLEQFLRNYFLVISTLTEYIPMFLCVFYIRVVFSQLSQYFGILPALENFRLEFYFEL